MHKFFLTLFLGCSYMAAAPKTELPLPRFASLRNAEVNVRVGPGFHYPLRWQIIRKQPVEITAEFDNWRKIRCYDGAEGWVHRNMLVGKRLAVIAKDSFLQKDSFEKGIVIAQLRPNVIGEMEKCAGKWCYLKVKDFKGWVLKDAIWGVYDHEEKL